MNVTATHFKKHFGDCLEKAMKGDVLHISRSGRATTVLISVDEHERLLKIEEMMLAQQALEAEKEGFVENGIEALQEMAAQKGVTISK